MKMSTTLRKGCPMSTYMKMSTTLLKGCPVPMYMKISTTLRKHMAMRKVGKEVFNVFFFIVHWIEAGWNFALCRLKESLDLLCWQFYWWWFLVCILRECLFLKEMNSLKKENANLLKTHLCKTIFWPENFVANVSGNNITNLFSFGVVSYVAWNICGS